MGLALCGECATKANMHKHLTPRYRSGRLGSMVETWCSIAHRKSKVFLTGLETKGGGGQGTPGAVKVRANAVFTRFISDTQRKMQIYELSQGLGTRTTVDEESDTPFTLHAFGYWGEERVRG